MTQEISILGNRSIAAVADVARKDDVEKAVATTVRKLEQFFFNPETSLDLPISE